MSKAYWINTFRTVRGREKLAAYVELAGPVMHEFGGRFLARGKPARRATSGSSRRLDARAHDPRRERQTT